MKSCNGIIGLAIGDAMGVPIEFVSRKELEQNPVTKMLEYGSHKVPKGCWSDDTSMTLATIDSIIKKKKIDTDDMADRFLEWFKNAEYTATNDIFDIGRTTLQSLARYELKLDDASNCGDDNEYSNGNGSLMRILPLAYYCFSKNLNNNEIIEIVSRVSSITHKNQVSILGCYIYVQFAMELLKVKDLKKCYYKIKELDYTYFSKEVVNRYERILKNNITEYKLEEIKSTGYIVDTLEATLWVLLNTKSYNEAIIKAINLGEDTDTIGACTGGLAGIYYGIDNIKNEWKENLLKYEYIIELCNKLDEILKKNNILYL